MLVPDGKGPFPVLVLNHGYIDPDTYFPGQGMPREHDYLARQGYVVFHTDYRGHASGDDDPASRLRAAAAVRGRHDQRRVRGEALGAGLPGR